MTIRWSEVLLVEACEVERGTSITRKGSRPGSVPVVAGGVEPTYYHDTPNRPAGTVTISGSGANAGFVNHWADPIFASDCCTVVPRRVDQTDSRFVYYALKNLQDFIFAELREGAAQPHVYAKDVAQLNIRLPDIEEQRRVVRTLDASFAAIEHSIAGTQESKTRLRDLAEAFLHSSIHRHTGDCSRRRLSDVAKDFGRGKSKHRPRNDPRLYGGRYPFIQTGDVRNAQREISTYSQTYNDLGLAQSKLWPKGTVCITIAANIAETAILDFEACFPDSIIGVVVDERFTSSEFVYYLLRGHRTQLQAAGKGSAQDNINLGTFESRDFPFPGKRDQNKVVALLRAVDADVARAEVAYLDKLAALQQLKRSLLHHAFTGQL
jgi:type I restriction enzyme, S subunit